jgi:hypothetical protein
MAVFDSHGTFKNLPAEIIESVDMFLSNMHKNLAKSILLL